MNSPRELLPDGHVVDSVQDFLLGRLDAEQRTVVRTHLAQCDECAADYEFALRLREEHSGREELEGFLEELPLPAAQETRRRPRTPAPHPMRWAASLLAVAAALLLFFNPFRSDELGLSGYAQLEALPVRVARDVPEAGSFEEARQLALTAYGDADYEQAIDRCRAALQLQPDSGEMTIYEASALALIGRLDESARLLDTLLVSTQPIAIVREARWQRAQVALTMEDEETARAQLEVLYAEDGLRQGDAEALLRRLSGQD